MLGIGYLTLVWVLAGQPARFDLSLGCPEPAIPCQRARFGAPSLTLALIGVFEVGLTYLPRGSTPHPIKVPTCKTIPPFTSTSQAATRFALSRVLAHKTRV
jgi:hypothetical protein